MLAKTFSATTFGLEPIKIEVEVDGTTGTPNLIIIGLPNKAVDEAKERITSALINCDIRIRSKRTVVNLAPADLKKTSSGLELAIAVGMLKMYGEISIQTDDTIFFGELSLDGAIKPIKGALLLTLAAKQMGFKKIVLPAANAGEVSIISGIKIYPIAHLRDYIKFAREKTPLPILAPQKFNPKLLSTDLDFRDILGQVAAKRALEIAAAGGHNVLLIGPPGAGKSMMAKAMISIMPDLTEAEVIEITNIYSICGLTDQGLILARPFRSPHHTTSQAGLIGGGVNLKPGEISLSHRGILFLDEFPEFPRYSLEALRQPLEDGVITIARASGSAHYPAVFTLVAAANPCPCGFYGSLKKRCVCTPPMIANYHKKISGPILDRIDLHLLVKEVEIKDLSQTPDRSSEGSAQIKTRVVEARKKQLQRLRDLPYLTNSQLPSQMVKKLCHLTIEAQQFLTVAAGKLNLSARSYFKVIKVAQTIADLAGQDQID